MLQNCPVTPTRDISTHAHWRHVLQIFPIRCFPSITPLELHPSPCRVGSIKYLPNPAMVCLSIRSVCPERPSPSGPPPLQPASRDETLKIYKSNVQHTFVFHVLMFVGQNKTSVVRCLVFCAASFILLPARENMRALAHKKIKPKCLHRYTM